MSSQDSEFKEQSCNCPRCTKKLNEYKKNYSLEKVLKTGGKSKYVYLLKAKDGRRLIKKRYDNNNPVHRTYFHHEVKILEHLNEHDCPFVPKILGLNQKKCIIYMTYCGEQPKNSHETFTKIKKLMYKLDDEYKVYRVTKEGFISKEYKVALNNVCERGNKIYLIDFGSPLWKLG